MHSQTSINTRLVIVFAGLTDCFLRSNACVFTHPVVASILQHPFFKHLSAENQERLISQSHEQQCQSGELLIRQGQPAERVFLSVKGPG